MSETETEHLAEGGEQESGSVAAETPPAAVAEHGGSAPEAEHEAAPDVPPDAPTETSEGEPAEGGEQAPAAEEPAAEEPEAEPEEQLSPEERRRRAQETRFFAAIGFQRVSEGLKDLCQGPLGRAVVGRMRVLYDEEAVKTCLEQTREMYELLKAQGRGPRPFAMGELPEPRSILARAKADRPLDARDLDMVRALLSAARETRQMLEGLEAGRAPRLQALAQHLDPVSPVLERLDAALERERGFGDQGSPKLVDLRGKLRTAREEVDKQLGEMAREATIAIALHNPRPVIRNNRLVLAVKAPQKSAVPGEVITKGQGGQILFVEPEKAAAKNAEIIALQQEERTELQSIAWELTRLVQAHEALLERTAGTLGWLDFTRAKALWALERGYEVPQVSADGVLELFEARHPLLEQARRERSGDRDRDRDRDRPAEREPRPVVPLTLTLGGKHDLLVISGPKQGGKTVALRTVGMCAVMAQCGLPIPASARTRVPVYTSFFADISEGRGGPASRSVYTAHLQRARELLREAGKGSLVLIDELGSGTSPEEGTALGQALLERMLQAGARMIVTTDLKTVAAWALSQSRAEVAALAWDSETKGPAFRLLVGQPGSTHTFEAAERMEIPSDVVARARELSSGDASKIDVLAARLESALVQAETDRARSEQLKQAALSEKKVLEDERHSIERKKKALAMESDLELEETFLKLQRAVRETTEKLKSAGGAVAEEMAAMQARVNELVKHTPFEQKRHDFAQKLKRGAWVYVVSMEKVGEVTKVMRDKGKLKVLCGPLEIETTFDNVSWVETKGLPEKAPAPKSYGDAEGEGGDDKTDEYGFRKGQRPTNYTGGFGGRGGGGGGGRGGRGGPGGGRGGPGGGRGGRFGGGGGRGGPGGGGGRFGGGGRGGPGGGRGPGGPGGGGHG